MIVRRLDSNHDMSFGHGVADMANEAESVAQRVQTRLLLLFSEWFLDTEVGVPYLQDVTIKPANLPLAQAVVKRTILEIRSFNMTLDRETRRLAINATVTNVYGTTSNIKVTK